MPENKYVNMSTTEADIKQLIAEYKKNKKNFVFECSFCHNTLTKPVCYQRGWLWFCPFCQQTVEYNPFSDVSADVKQTQKQLKVSNTEQRKQDHVVELTSIYNKHHYPKTMPTHEVQSKRTCLNKMQTIYIYDGFLPLHHKELSECLLTVRDLITNKPIQIMVTVYQKKDYLYIAKEQLQWYFSKGIRPKVFFKKSWIGTNNIQHSYLEFSDYSKLSMYGYSVKKSELTPQQRHRILRFLIQHDIVSVSYVVQHLQGLIAMRKSQKDKDFSYAINAWKQDIQFITDLKVKSIRKHLLM